MKENPLLKVKEFGQSIWLDYTRRDLIATGDHIRQKLNLTDGRSLTRFAIRRVVSQS